MGEIIFNYDYYINTICEDMERYIIKCENDTAKNKILAWLYENKPKRATCVSLKNVNKTNAKYILAKCVNRSQSNVDKCFKNSSTIAVKRPLNTDDVGAFYKYFSSELPLFLDVSQFLKSMLLSSRLLFVSSNLKLCLAAMIHKNKIGYEWTVDEIIEECKNYVDTKMLNGNRIRECLEKYSSGSSYKFAKDSSAQRRRTRYALFKKTEAGKYTVNLTEVIAYYNDFLKEIHTATN